MGSLKAGAGYLIIDHRDSPGLSAEDVAQMPGAVAAPGGTVLERDIKQCSHCGRDVLLEPLRTRERGYCPKCDHYICDGCEAIRVASGECVPVPAHIDRALAAIAKFAGQPDHPDAPADIILTDSMQP